MVSDKFEPTPERNGIYARAASGAEDGSKTNWELLRDVPRLYRELARLCSSEGWHAPQNLVRFGKVPVNKPWLEPQLFASEVVLKVLAFVRSEDAPAFVLTQEGTLPVRNSKIPVNDASGKIYALARKLSPVKELLPKQEISGDWAAVIQGWAALLGKPVEQLEESITPDWLAGCAADCNTLAQLGTKLIDGDGLAWLNELLGCVPKEGLQSFVHSRPVLPSQKGDLKKENELRLDDGIHETVKEVCEKLGVGVRNELLHAAIYTPPSTRRFVRLSRSRRGAHCPMKTVSRRRSSESRNL
jgi:hypothetical protein